LEVRESNQLKIAGEDIVPNGANWFSPTKEKNSF